MRVKTAARAVLLSTEKSFLGVHRATKVVGAARPRPAIRMIQLGTLSILSIRLPQMVIAMLVLRDAVLGWWAQTWVAAAVWRHGRRGVAMAGAFTMLCSAFPVAAVFNGIARATVFLRSIILNRTAMVLRLVALAPRAGFSSVGITLVAGFGGWT